MQHIRINDHLTVAGQPGCALLASLKNEGIDTVINVRPDGEAPDQPDHHEAAKAARGAGLGYHYLPVRLDDITRADVRAFQKALHGRKGHVFAHCGSGRRVLVLYVIGEVLDGRMHLADVEEFGRTHGVDLNAAIAWLKQDATNAPIVEGFYEPRTGSIQYVVTDPATRHCAIIDPVLDFDEKSGSVKTTCADAILAYIEREGLQVDWILDTHPHADHFTAAAYLKEKTGAPTGIGTHVKDVQKLWKDIYNMPDMATDGSQWDRLFDAGDTFQVGNLEGQALFSPGHTLASVTYVIGDAAFVHDTIFMPDSGTARADFPGGSTKVLWQSIQEILALPDETRLFTGHDYRPDGRQARWESTVGRQKRDNPHLASADEAHFIALRETRDKALPMPKLILHALQINTQAGRLPEPEENGTRYLKFPLNILENAAW